MWRVTTKGPYPFLVKDELNAILLFGNTIYSSLTHKFVYMTKRGFISPKNEKQTSSVTQKISIFTTFITYSRIVENV